MSLAHPRPSQAASATQERSKQSVSKRPLGRFLHRATLFLTVLALTAAAFHNGLIASVANQLRIPLAILLLITALHPSVGLHRKLADTPRIARNLITVSWALTAASAVLAPFSIAPGQAFLQLAVLGLLVATMHAHVVRRWHDSTTVKSDIRVVFWALGTTVIPSVLIGGGADAGRFSGMFDNPNTLALTSLFTLCLGLGLVGKGLAAFPVLATMLASVVALLLTETRTAIIAFAAALAVVLLKQLTRKSRIPLTVIGGTWAACCALCVILLTRGRLPLPAVAERFVGNDLASLNTRNLAWEYALDLWGLRPFSGYGFRLGELAFQQNRSLTAFTRDGTHNSYLQTLLEVGIVGMIPFALLILTILVAILRCPAKGAGAGVVALLVAGLISATTESFMLGVGVSMSWVFWLTAAAAACLGSASGTDNSRGEDHNTQAQAA